MAAAAEGLGEIRPRDILAVPESGGTGIGMSDDANIDAYFERIGFSGSIAPTLQTLEQLHALHPAAIPFENLDPLMGVPIRLELRNLEQKLLFEKRGGYCLEHNLLFKAMLEDLGFEVTAHAARVIWGHPEDEVRPASHIALSVDIAGTRYLADVGFSANTPTAPLRLRPDSEQETPHETFRLTGGDPEWRLQIRIGEEWRPVYAFETSEQSFEDFVAMNDVVQSSMAQRAALIVARAENGRRLALRNGELRLHPTGGETEMRQLDGVAGVKEALGGLFGISLPPAEKLDPAIERALAGTPAT
jgi:N-hydroxyarylamine O-acetyltransferase